MPRVKKTEEKQEYKPKGSEKLGFQLLCPEEAPKTVKAAQSLVVWLHLRASRSATSVL